MPDVTELRGDLRMLADKVGVRLALQISELFDGTPARLYGHRRWIIRYRDREMREEYDRGGITVVDLARKYKVCERTAYNILGQEPVDDRQLKLF